MIINAKLYVADPYNLFPKEIREQAYFEKTFQGEDLFSPVNGESVEQVLGRILINRLWLNQVSKELNIRLRPSLTRAQDFLSLENSILIVSMRGKIPYLHPDCFRLLQENGWTIVKGASLDFLGG